MDDPDDTPRHAVGVHLRAVANGVDPESGRLRATLIATPRRLADDEKPPTRVTLEAWPQDIVTYLASLSAGGSAAFPFRIAQTPSGKADAANDPRFSHLGEGEEGLKRVVRLWASAFEKVNPGAWTYLAKDIAANEDGKKQGTDQLSASYPGKIGQADDPTHENGALLVKPRRAADRILVKAVVANPQTRYAAEVEAARAQRVTAQIGGTAQPVAGSAPAAATTANPVEAPDNPDKIKSAKRAAFKDRFLAMTQETNASRERSTRVFGHAAHAVQESNAKPPAVGRPEPIAPFAPRDRVHGPQEAADASSRHPYAPRAGHVYGSWPQLPDPDAPPPSTSPGDPPAGEVEQIHAIYFTLQGDPLLSRLFGFAFDLTFEAPLYAKDGTTLYLAGQTDGIRTAALLARPAGKGRFDAFWPAPRPFPDTDASVPANEQRHGVYLFDTTQSVTSVDVRSAVCDAPDGVDRGGPQQTVGFTFLDGAAADRAARDLAVAKVLQQSYQANKTGGKADPLVLYAEELATGRRLDVKVGGSWRSLMNRYVGHPRLDREVGHRLDLVTMAPRGTDARGARRYLEETSLQRLSRAIPAVGSDGKNNDHAVESVVEEAYLTWGGAPLGALACRQSSLGNPPAPIMPVARSYDLPRDEFQLRPPPLRYGVAYLFGMRAAYLGGGGPSIAEAVERYDQTPGAVLPNDGVDGTPKRFLRHEAIAAPLLMLPASLVAGSNGPMGFEAPATVTLRSANAGDALQDGQRDEDPPGPAYLPADKRKSDDVSYRVLVAPLAGMDFCARHGVFDDPKTVKKVLDGGLLEARFLDITAREEKGAKGKGKGAGASSLERRGFPLATISRHEGFNADKLIYRREIGGIGVDPGKGETLGAVVFQSRLATDGPRAPGRGYLPDPAAKFLSLRVRVAGADIYLTGDLVVPLYDRESPAFPNAMPVLVEVRKAKGLRPTLACRAQEVVECLKPARYRFDLSGNTEQRQGVRVQRVRVTLYEYEQFDIEATCLPSADDLSDWFSLVETIGTQTLLAQTDAGHASLRAAVCGKQTAEEIDRQLGLLKKGCHCGVANAPACDKAGHQTIADLLLSFMRCKGPLTELAGVTIMRVAHAVNAPAEAPCLREVEVARTDAASPPAAQLCVLDADDDLAVGDSLAPVRFASVPGAKHLLLSGEIEVDLEQIDAIEVNAYAVSPDSNPVDDPTRGRGLLSRRAGRWPSAPAGERKRNYYYKRAVFGFDVAPDGRPSLIREKVTLLRIENLPDPRLALQIRESCANDKTGSVFLGARGRKIRLDLGLLHQAALGGGAITLLRDPCDTSSGQRILSVSRPHDIVDTAARTLDLEAVGVSRFARAFETAPLYSTEGKEHVLERRRPLRARDQRRTAPTVSMSAAATERPAAVGVRTPEPYFRIERCAIGAGDATRQVMKRKCGIRLRFDRGWFSRGEGERLGIVLWPPDYRHQKPCNLAKNKVVLVDGDDALLEGRTVSLPDLMDSDLGDGGAYVSRWGGDPIRGDLVPQTSWFIPPTAFACLDPAEDDAFVSSEKGAPRRAHAPEVVDRIRMPVEVQPVDPNDKTPQRSWLDVSLLTFEPYFDIESEEWFVDLPFSLAQATDPFIRLGLVRYQPNALSDDLKVSTPVRVWTQLPPLRRVVVTHARVDAAIDVTAVACGQASNGIKPLPIPAPRLMEKMARPRMRLTVFHESDDLHGIRRQTDLCGGLDIDGVAPVVKDGEFQWTMCARIDDDALEGLPDGRLVAWIEEIEHRLPATYPNEPVTVSEAFDPGATVASGPRFLAKVPFYNCGSG